MKQKLSRKICEHCYNHHHGYYQWFNQWFTQKDVTAWDVGGKILCPASLGNSKKGHDRLFAEISIYEEPPEWCPYRLEHLMDTQEEDKKW